VLTGGSDITSYDVSIWDNVNRLWVDEANVAAVDGKTEDYTYVDRGLARGTTYYYRVRARNIEGAGPYTAYKADLVPVAVPDAPELTVTPIGTGSIRLTWNVPADNGTPIEGYVLQRWVPGVGDNAGDWVVQLADTASVASTTLYVDIGNDANNNGVIDDDETGLAPGTTFYYRIRTEPESEYSAIKSAATFAAVPDAPVVMTPADADITHNSITIKWTAPDANGSAIVRYELQRWSTDTRQWVNVSNGIPATRTSYTHSNLTPETRYAYRLRAVNRASSNSGFGAWSTIFFVTTDEAPE
jgi:hypothetical protein